MNDVKEITKKGPDLYLRVFPSDRERLDQIRRGYGLSASVLVKALIVRLLNIIEDQGGLPLLPVRPADEDLDIQEDGESLHLTPLIPEVATRFEQVRDELNLSIRDFVMLAIRSGIDAYEKGELVLPRRSSKEDPGS